MSKSGLYKIYSSGGVLSGFEPSDVTASFASLFKAPPEKALSFIEGRKLVSKDLSESEAQKYKARLTWIGLPVTVEQVAVKGAGSNLDLELAPVAQDQSTTDSSTADNQIASGTIQSPVQRGFCCPKCDLEQTKSEQCTSCGIFFSKYQAGGKSRSRSTANASHARAHAETNNDILSLSGLAFPLMAAILGAFAWKMIALSTGYEFGFVAWAIGGAVGVAAVFSRASGDVTGFVCAVLTLLSIFGGKYLIVSDYQRSMEQLFSGDGAVVAVQELYDQAAKEVLAFEQANSDAAVKDFMVEYGYSNAKAGIFVTANELEDFQDEIQPWLEEEYMELISEDGLADAGPEIAAAFSEMSATSMVFDSLGLLDLVFAFLGVSTAFRLGRSGVGA